MLTPEQQQRMDAIMAKKSPDTTEIPSVPENAPEVPQSTQGGGVTLSEILSSGGETTDAPEVIDLEQKRDNAMVASAELEEQGVPQKRSFAAEFGSNLLEAPKAFGRGLEATHDLLFGGSKVVGDSVAAGLVGGKRQKEVEKINEMNQRMIAENPDMPAALKAKLSEPATVDRSSDPTFLEVLGGSGEIALDVLTMGQAKAATVATKAAWKEVAEKLGKESFPEFVKALGKKIGSKQLAINAGLGAGYGASGSLQSGDDEFIEVVQDTLIGMGLGSALWGAGKGFARFNNKTNDVIRANDDLFRAIKPRITKKKNLNKVQDNMVLANKTLVEEGIVPGDLKSYVQGISDGKSKIWDQIEESFARSEGTDAAVDLQKISDEIRVMAADKTLKRVDPSAAKKLDGMADTLVAEGGQVAPMEAERIKQYLNAELGGAFGEFNFSKAEQNAKKLITKQIGAQLDETLSRVPGEFQELKNKYGALRGIEDDVIKRYIVFERANPAGLVESFGAVEGGSNIIKGLASLDPGSIAKGVGQFTLARMQKKANDANELVKKSFERLSQSSQPKSGTLSKQEPQDPEHKSSEKSITNKGTGVNQEDVLYQDEIVQYVSEITGKSKDQVRNDFTKGKTDGIYDDIDDFLIASEKNAEAASRADVPAVEFNDEFVAEQSKLTPAASLITEAKKYKSADEFVESLSEKRAKTGFEWHGEFQSFPPIEAITMKSEDLGDLNKLTLDKHYNIDSPFREAILEKASKKGEYKIYRAVPNGAGISSGDYVFTSKKSADDFFKNFGKKRGYDKIVSKEVSLNELIIPDNPIHNKNMAMDEFIYSQKDTRKTKSQLKELWNKANK